MYERVGKCVLKVTKRDNTFSSFTGGGGGGLVFGSKQNDVNNCFFQGPRQFTYSDCEVPGMPGRCFHGKIPTAQSTLQYEVVSSLGSLNFTFVFLCETFLIPQLSLLVCSFGSMHYLVHNKLEFFFLL